jgi:CheY-like chemotaxis protein
MNDILDTFKAELAFQPAAKKELWQAAITTPAAAKVPPAVVSGTRILIVEDDFENVTLLRAYLENKSLSLDFAANGLEGLEKRRSNDYDLIFMDMQMPIMDGYRATREIRAWERANGQRRAPVVALSAHAINGALGNSLEAGCDAHINKPIEASVLLNAIAVFAKPLSRQPPAATEIPLRTSTPGVDGISESVLARRPLFLANRRRDLEKLQAALAIPDFAAIRTIAHNCKGIGTGYGFPQISSLGLQISTAAKAFDIDRLHECLRDFDACLAAASS